MYVNRFDQRRLAWSMVDVAAQYLMPDDRSWLYAKIGAGELESALITLVGTCMRHAVVLPVDVEPALRDWLRGYSGTEVAAAFDSYIARTHTNLAVTGVDSVPDGLRVNDEQLRNRPRRAPLGSAQPALLQTSEPNPMGQQR